MEPSEMASSTSLRISGARETTSRWWLEWLEGGKGGKGGGRGGRVRGIADQDAMQITQFICKMEKEGAYRLEEGRVEAYQQRQARPLLPSLLLSTRFQATYLEKHLALGQGGGRGDEQLQGLLPRQGLLGLGPLHAHHAAGCGPARIGRRGRGEEESIALVQKAEQQEPGGRGRLEHGSETVFV